MVCMPSVELLVPAHLQPQLSPMSPKSSKLQLKADRFQLALNEKAYNAASLAVRVFNVFFMLSAYQPKLCKDLQYRPKVWTASRSKSFLYFHDYEYCSFTLKASKL
ncbi:hypothetical protein ILYODFUR_038447 [Ilyodon furcidens]|uniref:Uncharacterized protein n=1 Tax=Ilyodon furcidens TaxID=33524 RepID=A0ABV0VKK6_9TELE